MSEWYDKDDGLTTARKRAKWDDDAAAIAQAQDRIEALEAALRDLIEPTPAHQDAKLYSEKIAAAHKALNN